MGKVSNGKRNRSNAIWGNEGNSIHDLIQESRDLVGDRSSVGRGSSGERAAALGLHRHRSRSRSSRSSQGDRPRWLPGHGRPNRR